MICINKFIIKTLWSGHLHETPCIYLKITTKLSCWVGDRAPSCVSI